MIINLEVKVQTTVQILCKIDFSCIIVHTIRSDAIACKREEASMFRRVRLSSLGTLSVIVAVLLLHLMLPRQRRFLVTYVRQQPLFGRNVFLRLRWVTTTTTSLCFLTYLPSSYRYGGHWPQP